MARPYWVTTYLAAQPSQPNIFIGDGNSMMAGQGGTPITTQIAASLSGWTIQNTAVGGVDTPNRITNENTNIVAKADLRRGKRVVALLEAMNDLYFWVLGTSSTTFNLQDVKDHYQTYCQNARNANFKVVVFTIPPRSNAPMTAPQIATYEAQRLLFNTWLRANYTNFADGICDVAADSRLGDAGCETNTTYYAGDNVHWNTTGYGVVTTLLTPIILSF